MAAFPLARQGLLPHHFTHHEIQRLAEVAGLSKASLKRAKQFRVGGLRAYGNAINAIAAQTFIESILEMQ